MLIEVLWFVLPLEGDLLNLYCTHSTGQTLKMGKANVLIIIFIISYLFYVLFLLSDFLISSVITLQKRTTLNSEQPV